MREIGSSMVERWIFRRSRVRIPFYFFYYLFSFTRKENRMNVKMTLKRNSPKILTILAAMGTVSTAFATARATPKALLLIREAESQKGEDLTALEKVKVAAVPYIPAVLLGSATVICIFGAQMLNRRVQSSMASAYALLDQSFKDYRRKLKELYGDEADKKVIEALAVEKSQTVYINASYLDGPCDLALEENSSKPVLWYDEYSKRFFTASLEQVLMAEYHLNRNYILRGEAVINELYEFLGLEPTDWGAEAGWAPMDEGMFWIEFNHIPAKLDDGSVFYIIEMPFEPILNYDEYY